MSSDDPGAPEPAPSPPHPYSYVTVRLTAAEFERVARAAQAAGQTVPDFAREAILPHAGPTR